MEGNTANVGDMDKETRNLWKEIIPALSWNLRTEDFPTVRFSLGKESLRKLQTLLAEFAGPDDPNFFEKMFTGPRTNDYITGEINSLFAYRNLTKGLRSDMPLIDLHSALRGLLPEYDRLNAVDFSEPELFESSRPEIEVVMGILRTGSYLMDYSFLNRHLGGAVSLTEPMKKIVAKHPEKAAIMAELIHSRDLDNTNINAIEELLDNAAAPALMEGTL